MATNAVRALLIMSFVALAGCKQQTRIQEMPPDAPTPPGSAPRIIDGMVATGELLDWRANEIKTKLLSDKKVVACFNLTPSNVERAFDVSAKICKQKVLNETPPKLKPPDELEKPSSAFIFCLRDTMLKNQGVSSEKFLKCAN